MSSPERNTNSTGAAKRTFGLAGERGLSLIESLVAIAIVALSAASIGGLITHQIRQAASNELATKAYALAAEELEEMRGLPYATMSNASRDEVVGSVVFAVQTTVASGVPAANMKKITVVVSWKEPEGTRDVTISTVYTSVQRS